MAKTVATAVQFEPEPIKGSRFLCCLMPAQDVTSVVAKQASLRREHPRSCHVCYAYVGACETDWRHSDDGEPKKTAGVHMFNVLRGQGLLRCAALVTRYFGGVKLGTGGLARAYAGAVRETIQQAELREIVHLVEICVRCSFAEEPALRRRLLAMNASSIQADYDDSVKITCLVPEAKLPDARTSLRSYQPEVSER